MKKILILIFVSFISLSAALSSCSGGAKLTPEQLDSIARAVGPDSLLINVKDAEYAVVTRLGICSPDSLMLYIKGCDGEVYSTNVSKVGDEWANVVENAYDKLSILNDSVWTTLPDSVFTPEAKALVKHDQTLAQIGQECKEVFNAEIEELNLVATAVCKGDWKDTTDGELKSKMSKGQRLYFTGDEGSDGVTTLVSTSIMPINAQEGLFEIRFRTCYTNQDGRSYMTRSGNVRFDRKDGKFVMIYSSNVHALAYGG